MQKICTRFEKRNFELQYFKNIRTHLGKDLGDPMTAGASGGERAQFKDYTQPSPKI